MVFSLYRWKIRKAKHSGSWHGLSSEPCRMGRPAPALLPLAAMNHRLKIGLVQQACSEDRNHNLAASAAGIRAAEARGAQLVLLQELHTGVYFCQTEDTQRFDQAESLPGPTSDALGTLAKELGIVIVASVFERRAAGLY